MICLDAGPAGWVEEVTELIRAREVALSLQEAMLPAPGPAGDHRAAVRYRPAAGALHVGGDWYDLADLPGGRLAVAVGDVAGHGLPAAGVMTRPATSTAEWRCAADPQYNWLASEPGTMCGLPAGPPSHQGMRRRGPCQR
jgi:Stage II sporulation protein E (SpoIIE)